VDICGYGLPSAIDLWKGVGGIGVPHFSLRGDWYKVILENIFLFGPLKYGGHGPPYNIFSFDESNSSWEIY
jgi:hypothetical protein